MAIYQEKNKNKIPKDGRCWYYRCYYTDMYGNRKQKQSKFFYTKKEAQEEERVFLVTIEKSNVIDNNISFEKVCLEWLNYKTALVKSTTYYSIDKKVKKHILPFFIKYKLHSIKADSITAWKENLLTNNFCIDYTNTIISYLKEILQYSADNYDFNSKVVNKIQKYRNEFKYTKKPTSNNNFWSYDEFCIFINCVDDDFDKLTYNVLYYTGMRLGEMVALKWEDVNFERKTILINKTFTNKVFDKNKKMIDPKTINANRIIELDDNLLNLLKQHYEQEKNIYNFNHNMFVFGNVKNIGVTTFARHLDNYIKKANVKRMTPHGFRHSHVSLLIDLGCDRREVADRIGDTLDVMEKTYYHMFPDKKSKTVSVLNKLNS